MAHKVVLDFSQEMELIPGDMSIGAFYQPIFDRLNRWAGQNCLGRVWKTSYDGEYGEIVELMFENQDDALLFKLSCDVRSIVNANE
jgi:hypothetical protein